MKPDGRWLKDAAACAYGLYYVRNYFVWPGDVRSDTDYWNGRRLSQIIGGNEINYAMYYVTMLPDIAGGVYPFSSGTCPINKVFRLSELR